VARPTFGLVLPERGRYLTGMADGRRRNRVLLGLLLLGLAARAGAAVPAAPAAPAATAASIPVLQETVGLAEKAAAIPVTAAEILCLPWGLLECLLCPLPNVSFSDGLEHIGTGVVAPFKLVKEVVSLPYEAVTTAGHAADKVVPAAK